MRGFLILFAGLSVLAGDPPQAAAQEAPVAPGVGPAPDVAAAWDALPAATRARYEPRLAAPPAAQAVLYVQNAVVPDAEFRVVEHGQILIEQFIRPGGLARITQPVQNAEKYGPMGAVLWPGIGPDGQYWCWKRAGSLHPIIRNNIYCYQDNDDDGVSERLMENTLWQSAPITSHFQFTSIGRDERVRESATFRVEPGTVGEMEELVILRFYGVTGGLIQADGSLSAATVEFEFLTGPDRENLGKIQHIRINTDLNGRGEFHLPNGVGLMVDGVTLDGSARIRVLGGLPAGRALLFPPITREYILERFGATERSDGTPMYQGKESEVEGQAASPPS